MYYQVFIEITPWKRPLHLINAYLAKIYLKLLPQLQIIAITGSVGKTLTQNAILSVIREKFRVNQPEENLDPIFRIPRTILKTRPWDKYIVLEYGVEHVGDMDYYLWLVKPTIVAFTKITPTHTKFFGTQEGVFREKVKLTDKLSQKDIAILNADDIYSKKAAMSTKAKIIWYGKNAKDRVKITNFNQDFAGSSFTIKDKNQKAQVRWKIIGRHQLVSAYIACQIGLLAGLTIKQIANGLSKAQPPNHRLNTISKGTTKIIDDTYNSSPSAAAESIKTLIDLGRGMKKIAILGEMKDLGTLSTRSHYKLGQILAKSNIDVLATIGPVAKIIENSAKSGGFVGKTMNFISTKEAIVAIKKMISARSIVLVKGSRHAHLERIVSGLCGEATSINCYHCGRKE